MSTKRLTQSRRGAEKKKEISEKRKRRSTVIPKSDSDEEKKGRTKARRHKEEEKYVPRLRRLRGLSPFLSFCAKPSGEVAESILLAAFARSERKKFSHKGTYTRRIASFLQSVKSADFFFSYFLALFSCLSGFVRDSLSFCAGVRRSRGAGKRPLLLFAHFVINCDCFSNFA